MAILKQSTAYSRMVLLVDSTDHITGKTGLTPTVTLSKAGGAFAAAGGAITEVAHGWYKIALTTTDTNTLGELAYHATAAGADPTDMVDQVSARLVDDLPTTADLAAVQADVDDIQTRLPAALVGGRIDAHLGAAAAGVLAAASFAAGALDAVWSTTTRLLTAGTNIVLVKGVGVTGFNDLSAAQVNAEADTALADYDGPTHAELTSEINDVQTDVAGVQSDTNDIQTRLPAALVGGRIDASAGALASGVITSSSFTAGAIDNLAIAPDAIGSSELAASATSEIATAVWANSTRTLSAFGFGVLVVTNSDKTGYTLSTPGILAIWNQLVSALTTASTVGKLLVDNINATISSRATQTSVDTVDDFIDTEVAAIKAKTDNLPASPAATGDIPTAGQNADAVWDEALAGHVAAGSAGEALGRVDVAVSTRAAVADIPTANQNADALLDRAAGVETGMTPRQSFRLMLAALAGKLSGAATTTVTIRDTTDTKNRLTATVDSDGNRTAITYDAS